jgi:imidazolonepropionase-like amidohydrolase
MESRVRSPVPATCSFAVTRLNASPRHPFQRTAAPRHRSSKAAGVEATDTLMRGFTTVRDVGGPVFGLKTAIDSGVIAGPRIFP